MKVQLAAATAMVGALSLLTACGSSGSSNGSDGTGPIRIGTTGAFSGANASTGDANKAVIAYFKNLNANGGINGRKVEVVQGDDQYNASLSPGIARKLIPNVVAFCGNNGTDENIAMQSILAQSKVPNIAPATGSTALSQPVTDTQYLVVPDYGRLTAGLIDYAVKTLHKSRIAVIYLNDSAGEPVIKAAKSEAKKLNAKIVDTEPYSASATTMSSQVQKVKASRPDFVFVEAVTGGFALTVNAAKSIGLDTTWGNLFFGGTPQFADLTHNATSGKAYVAGFVNAPSDPKAQEALKIVHGMYSSIDEANAQAMQGWTLADTCAGVIKKTLDAGEKATSANLIKTMKSFKLDDDYVHGLSWSPKSHSGVNQFQVLAQKGSKFVPVTDFQDSPSY